MPYQHILYSVDERVATITLNRPDVLNAYTPDMGDEIVAAFRAAEKDVNVRAVILTGAGERGFCAGADRIYLQQPLPEGTRIIGEEELIKSFALELALFPKPTIAALNGHAVGIGMTMILPLDMRVAADTAKLALNFANRSFIREDDDEAGYKLAEELHQSDFFQANSPFTVVIVSGRQTGKIGATDTIKVRTIES